MKIWDALQVAQAHHNADEAARQSVAFDDLTVPQNGQRTAIEETNLGVQELESALSAGPSSPALANLKSKFAGWPSASPPSINMRPSTTAYPSSKARLTPATT